MRITPVLLGVLLLLGLLAGAALVFHEKAVNLWLQHKLRGALAQAWQAEVELEDLVWRAGELRARRGAVVGGALPFESLIVNELRVPVEWRQLFQPTDESFVIEAGHAEIVLAPLRPGNDAPAVPEESAANWPGLDLLIARLNLAHRDGQGWSIQDSAVRAVHENGTWSVAAHGGTVQVFGLPPFGLDRISATRQGDRWKIGSFAARHGDGGVLAGSAMHDDDGWSGEFSYQDIPLDALLTDETAEFVRGRFSGDALLEDDILRGQIKITGGSFENLPLLVRMASLFAGENWGTIPWEVFRFDFVRHPDGSIDFSELQALSPAGLALRGSGHYAPDKLEAEFQLGVKSENRPWLVAFMPVLFRAENAGYMWTTIRVSGTPENPVEDLTGRLVAAVAVAPVSGAVEAAAEAPAQAIDAAGRLLRGLIGR